MFRFKFYFNFAEKKLIMSRIIDWEEIEQHHGDAETVWTVINGKVYDLTRFLDEHPGGRAILVENAGLDSSQEFEDVGHSKDAREMLDDYEIGRLEEDLKQGTDSSPWSGWIPIACASLGILVLARLVISRM